MTIAFSSNYIEFVSCSFVSNRDISCRVRVAVRASARVLVLWGKVRIVELWRVSAMCEWGSSRWINTGPRLPSFEPYSPEFAASGNHGTQAVSQASLYAPTSERELGKSTGASSSAESHRIANTTTDQQYLPHTHARAPKKKKLNGFARRTRRRRQPGQRAARSGPLVAERGGVCEVEGRP